MKNNQLNIARIKQVYEALGDLQDKVVFVGGATVSLYADRQAIEVRPTMDVDILVEVGTLLDFSIVEEQLRQKGFKNDTTASFMSRYLLDDIIIDIMPTYPEILGFANKWYDGGLATATEYKIDEQCTVKIFTAPYFIASKLEAFKNRGNNDGRLSDDFEDIIFVLENRRTIWTEMNETDDVLRNYLKAFFAELAIHPDIEEWIASHSSFRSSPGSFYIVQEWKDFAAK